jgi:hypothetical protein
MRCIRRCGRRSRVLSPRWKRQADAAHPWAAWLRDPPNFGLKRGVLGSRHDSNSWSRRWAPIVSKRRIQSFCFCRIHAPESVTRDPIQEVVARMRWPTLRRHRECSGIIGSPELIETRVSFPTVDRLLSNHPITCIGRVCTRTR